MARLIFKAPYYKPNAKAGKGARGAYAKYIATRDGVELLRSGMADYINERKGSNGLFSDEGVVINLSQIEETINNHSGNVWGLIFSLKREDAERLGYNTATQWMNLLRSRRNDIAREMHIAPGNLRWYAAYHNSTTHPHVHMLVWSDRAKEPRLTKDGIYNIKHTMAKDIFRQELYSVYSRQTHARDNIKMQFRERLEEILATMKVCSMDEDGELALKFQALAQKIDQHKGKKVYGYLDKDTKKLVDEIVKMIAVDERISELYDLWYKCRCEVYRTYTDVMPERLSLESNDEFKSIRNEVVRMAANFEIPYELYGQDDKEPSDEVEDEDYEELKKYAEGGEDDQSMYLLGKKCLDEYDDPEEAEKWLREASDCGNVYAMYLLYKCYRDERIKDEKREKMKYLKMAVEEEYDVAEYEYGKLLREKDPEEAMKYFKKAADKNHSYAAYAYARMCAERGDVEGLARYAYHSVVHNHQLAIRVGLWIYYDLEDHDLGRWYLKYAADRGYDEARDILKALDERRNLKLAFGILNLLGYTSNIIDERAHRYHKGGRIPGVDRKLLEQMKQKNEGLGLRMG